MSDLTNDRDHFRALSTAEHKLHCRKSRGFGYQRPNPDCPGCNPPADRALFARLANEIDAYLDADDHQGDLFGGVA